MCVDYSQTVNLFTELDAYPIPNIEEIVHKLSKYSVFATYDLKSANHQVPICLHDKPFTAFQAGDRLWEFNRIPFGVKNDGPVFQRIMGNIVKTDKLRDTVVNFDNVIIEAFDNKCLIS